MKTIVLALGLVFIAASTALPSTRSDFTKSFPLQTLKPLNSRISIASRVIPSPTTTSGPAR